MLLKKSTRHYYRGDIFMIDRNLKHLRISAVVLSVVCFLSSNAFAGGSFSIKWGDDTKAEQQQVKNKSKKQKVGPPAHAPAHGYRAKYQYR
jgi:hypothetical protein